MPITSCYAAKGVCVCVCVWNIIFLEQNILACFVIVIVNFTMFFIVFFIFFVFLLYFCCYCYAFCIFYLLNVMNVLFCFYSSKLVANVITWKARYKLTEAFRNIWSYAAVQRVKLRSLHRFVEAELTCRQSSETFAKDSITFGKIHHPISWQLYESIPQWEVSFVWKHWAVTSWQSNGRTLHGAIKLPN